MYPAGRSSQPRSFLFAQMQEEPDALDRLDLRFRWGRYGIQVLRCHLISFPAGYVIPYHKHRDYEFHFIPRGKGVVFLQEGSFPLHTGMFYLTGPQVLHQQISDQQDPMYELCLHVNIVPLEAEHGPETPEDWGNRWEMAEADACMRQLQAMPATPTLDSYNAMHWFLTAYQAWQEREFGAFTTIRQAIIQILLRAARVHQSLQPTLPARNMNAYRYQLATQYIRDNYASPLTLKEVADELRIGSRQLQRIIREYANETFSSYLEHYRLTQVCLSLTHTDLTVKELAALHGFSSGSYLHYVFKKHLGVTPAHYREQQRQK
ncbi:AraC-like protein [Thermosporothrix hazakensis]|jgi:AraC-like DNA-binding protein/mannose-6-phosphate isomerase-like protein (cupin superfamily)|uniref:AraC-like protein n=2 Tax=Thermosporothrix hazakensis TaxID=644383 RepID=A0A326U2K5_THEHA|nr:helix-turn-helix domain-containing protein [Thermosporothrix hazakensis]PZW25653.1 AraC-like protein [Thermosporothrix hazakensis]GCE48148.1 hypothetical protein KTH_30170 [Thermosporothrix hazakensis]